MLYNHLLNDHVKIAENCKITHEISYFFKEHPVKDCNNFCFHSCAFTYAGKILSAPSLFYMLL